MSDLEDTISDILDKDSCFVYCINSIYQDGIIEISVFEAGKNYEVCCFLFSKTEAKLILYKSKFEKIIPISKFSKYSKDVVKILIDNGYMYCTFSDYDSRNVN